MGGEDFCLNCQVRLDSRDEDPNGDKNVICARCRAEEDHDFDAEPNATFDRSGNQTSPPTVNQLLRELVATEYVLRKHLEDPRNAVRFCLVGNPTGNTWAVRQWGNCLSKDGEWELERPPSDRNDDFYSRCRFDSLRKAIGAYRRLG